MTTKWDNFIIITGNINIDLIRKQKEFTKCYKNILCSFNLHQHITKPTRKSISLIDHICSNVPNKLMHNRLFHERRAIAHVCTHAHLEMFRQAENCPPNKQQMAGLVCFDFFTSLTEKRKI